MGSRMDAAGEGSQWSARLSAWQGARQESETVFRTYMAARAKVEAEAPRPDELERGDFRTELQIHCAPDLGPREKSKLIDQLRRWQTADREARDRHGLAALDDACEAAVAAESDAFDRLLDAPAPDAAAFMTKYRLYWARIVCEQEPEQAETVDVVSEMLSGEPIRQAGTRLLQDALRLSGDRPDLAALEPFDAAGFVASFEAHAGHHIAKAGAYFTDEAVQRREKPVGSGAWDSLADWQKEAASRFAGSRATAAS